MKKIFFDLIPDSWQSVFFLPWRTVAMAIWTNRQIWKYPTGFELRCIRANNRNFGALNCAAVRSIQIQLQRKLSPRNIHMPNIRRQTNNKPCNHHTFAGTTGQQLWRFLTTPKRSIKFTFYSFKTHKLPASTQVCYSFWKGCPGCLGCLGWQNVVRGLRGLREPTHKQLYCRELAKVSYLKMICAPLRGRRWWWCWWWWCQVGGCTKEQGGHWVRATCRKTLLPKSTKLPTRTTTLGTN